MPVALKKDPRGPVMVQLLRTDACSHGAKAEELLREVVASTAPGTTVEVVQITSSAQAQALRFAGSPTVLVDGVDLEPDAPVLTDFG